MKKPMLTKNSSMRLDVIPALRISGLLAVATLLTSLSSCVINPATGQGNIVLMTESREKEIGAEEHAKVMSSMAVYEDPKLQAYVTRVGMEVAAVSHRPDLDYLFTIIDSPEINAFALPGGYVYVNRGLLTYLNSEAQLAAVLSHEIGHITARHAVQQHGRTGIVNAASAVGGFVAAVATGSGYVGSQISQITSIWAQTGLSGYGREHELEADSLGAEYLYEAGYEPAAMIEVITVLKNQEDFNRKVSGGGSTYHGLFATHPRNDTRLKEAITKAGTLTTGQLKEVNASEFRNAIDGMLVGESSGSRTRDERNRYYQTLLGYTMVFPDAWLVTETTTTVTATSATNSTLSVEAQRIQANIEPRVFIRDKLGISNLQKSEALSQYRLLGHTGVVPSAQSGQSERLAVIYLGARVYIFRGKAVSVENLDAADAEMLVAIKTFRAVQGGEGLPGNEPKIKYVQASEFFDFATVITIPIVKNLHCDSRFFDNTLRYKLAGNTDSLKLRSKTFILIQNHLQARS